MPRTVIKLENVYKDFKLPHQGESSVKGFFVNPFVRNNRESVEVQHALRNISLDIKEGEFFGIVGRNGSGKSTLLKLIAGIYQPTKGKATINGRLVPFIELGVGFNPELSGRENVYLNGALMGFSTKEVDAKYDAIVDFAELERFMDQRLKNYSSGMQVRLAFSVATILADSDILLIDEVLAVGDADFQRKCFNYFRKLKKDKKTVIFVSHDMEAIREYCDRCVVIKDSKKVFEGKTEKAADLYLEMFTQKKEDSKEVSDEEPSNRWGDGSGQFENVKVSVSDKFVTVNAEVHYNEDMEAPIIGAQVSNSTGQPICGTNTKILRKKISTVKKGERMKCGWVFPNIFSEGDYMVDFALTRSDGITQADWWREALPFSINNKFNTPHITSPDIELTVDLDK